MPEPTILRETARTKAFLREEGGTRSVTEGARVTLSVRKFNCIALSLSRLTAPAPSRREPLCKPVSTKNTTKEISLVVFVFFSAKVAEPNNRTPFSLPFASMVGRCGARDQVRAIFAFSKALLKTRPMTMPATPCIPLAGMFTREGPKPYRNPSKTK